jgi:hypothetical protein
LLPPPPPHATTITRPASTANAGSLLQRRRFEATPSTKIPASTPPEPVFQNCNGSRVALWGAVAVTVRVVEPLPVTDAGLKLQALSAGRPVHEAGLKLMVPVYPV